MPSKEHEALVEKVARVICFETGSMGDPMPINCSAWIETGKSMSLLQRLQSSPSAKLYRSRQR
ncbi:hypothetical protein HED54_14800 [Ochrobactrum anthropi ATCC 49188]|nr:hypothetical protein [Brucella anthropi ATCC 49188]